MMDWLFEFGLFFAKVATFVIAFGVLIVIIAKARGGSTARQHLRIRDRQEYYRQYREQLEAAQQEKSARQQFKKARAKADKKALKSARKAHKQDKKAPATPTLWVLDFNGDIRASREPSFSQEITALLPLLKKGDEVVVRLESGGGLVHAYGLAASQIERLKQGGARLSVCVDKVAASGGYMMACCADHVVAAPFAVIGSIGVVAQVPNFHRFLKKNDVDVEVLTAGRHKRTLTLLGENTEEGRQKFLEDLKSTHQLFKSHVSARRPGLDIEQVADGEIWYGQQALDKGLIDQVTTSDEYIESKSASFKVLEVTLVEKQSPLSRLGGRVQSLVERGVDARIKQVMEQEWQRY
ncbi:protease SohB [Larsenimonas suaedae]|uniref:Protease SohB n=2 Tax=Larsenimonas suaedae TaxID=1851019 RepID=A0ABU1GVA8_9GAMM|nr:protease SohB [Larsenimonas suaedae]MDR5895979.1 protease SohB [Larsenimonas suaedae]